MNAAAYDSFTAELLQRLRTDAAVLRVVALGTTADPTYRDRWSDHDFWVITRPGYQEVLLDDLSWLPSSQQILIAARHGRRHYSVLYRDGHLVEFAIFDSTEAAATVVTVGNVLFERAKVGGNITKAAVGADHGSWDETRSAFTFDNFLILLRTAVARWQRGERLSARRYLGQFAVDSLLGLALEHAPASVASGRDALDPRRRIERLLPDLAGAVERLACAPVPAGAVGLLDVAEKTLAARWPHYPATRVAVVRKMLRRMSAEATEG